MLTIDCLPRFSFPDIDLSIDELNDAEERAARDLAGEIARLVARGAPEDRTNPRRCSVEDRLGRRIRRFGERSRAAAIRGARKIVADRDIELSGDDDPDPEITGRFRQLFRRRLTALRSQFTTAIAELTEQGRTMERLEPLTTVDMRPAGEIASRFVTHMQIYTPEHLLFRWRSELPKARRVYWQLFGPVKMGDMGEVLETGIVGEGIEGDETGGFWEIELRHYLPPVPPSTPHRYHVRVLPLGEPSGSFAPSGGPGLGTAIEGAPLPPHGIGAWSRPAIIDYGTGYLPPPQEIDIQELSFYRRAKFSVHSFRVDADQPGPGDEEYHIRGFVVEHNRLGARRVADFGSYLEIEEGDSSEHPLGWSAYADLGRPDNPVWASPRAFFCGIAVMEEDAGVQLDDFFALVTEITDEILTGELGAEVQALLDEVEDEVALATGLFVGGLSTAMTAFIVAAIASVLTKFLIAYVALIIAFVGGFIGAGSRDDFYGLIVHALVLVNNLAEKIASGEAVLYQHSRIAAAGFSFSGTDTGTRFIADPTEIQMFGENFPEGAGFNGIVRVKFSWEFYDKVTEHFSG